MTDQRLQLALAKMLPEKLEHCLNCDETPGDTWWKGKPQMVLDTEWLHVCWLVEQTFVSKSNEYSDYFIELLELSNHDPVRASWQQRATALAKVKGIEIV